MKPMPSVTAFALKVAAIVGMTCNHIANVFGSELPEGAMVALYSLGGLTFPIMAYLLCEGYRHTSSVRRYAERLAVFAVVSQIPYSLLFGATGNVLITLLIGLGMLWLVDHQRQNLALCALGLLGGLAVSSFCDWGIIGPLMILLFWHFHDRPRGVALAMLVPFLGLGLPALSWAISDPVPLSLGVLGYYTVGFGLAQRPARPTVEMVLLWVLPWASSSTVGAGASACPLAETPNPGGAAALQKLSL